MRAFLALLLVASALAVPLTKITETTAEEDTLFERFKSSYRKVYFDSHDETYRKAIFLANLAKIRTHNDEFSQGKHTFTMAMNEFGDLTFEEFHAKYTGYRGPRNNYLRSRNTAELSHVTLAASVDWSEKGAVTPVKNQGQCGSCWAFSTTGSVEGAWFISNGTLVSLSEQELMDCSKAEGNQSCEGGLMDQAFEFIIKKGICSEAEYPYKQRDESSCKTCTAVAHISKYVDVEQSEVALQTAVTQQPVSVAIEADQDAFQFYESGVLTGQCGTNLDHGVLAVGFGTDNNVNYWKVKNSWGESWGEKGYVRIEKGKKQTGGQCGILMAASYPVV